MHTGSVCLILGAALGIGAALGLHPDALLLSAVAATVGAILAMAARRPWWIAGASLLVGAVLTSADLRIGLAARLPLSEDGGERAVAGWICSLPEVRGDRVRFELCRTGADQLRRIRLSSYGPDRIHPRLGERWAVRARMRVPLSYLNPAGPDLAADSLFDGRDASGTVLVAHRIAAADPASEIRAELADAAAAELPMEAGLARALLVGARDGLSDADWDLLRRTGTAHLIAISGLHVTLVMAWVLFIGRIWRWCAAGSGTRGARALVLGLLAATAYAALAGWAIPTRRALAMLAVLVLAQLARRRRAPLAVLCLGAGIVVLMDPLAVAQLGFWMSVCAVAALSIACASGEGVALGLLRTQLIVSITTLPLAAMVGGVIGPATVLANLFAIPWLTLLVLPALLLGASAWILGLHALAAVCWWTADLGLSVLRSGLTLFAGLPAMGLPQPANIGLAVAASLGLIMGLGGQRVLPASCSAQLLSSLRVAAALTAVAILLFPSFAQPAIGELQVTVVDVGQGLAVVLRTREHTLVYDTGPSWHGGGATAAITLVPVLREAGVRRVDLLVLSHGDDDHAGGTAVLARSLPVMDRLGWGGRSCRRGQDWRWDGVEFRVLHPADGSLSGNDSSCVLAVRAAGHSLLLTGDIEAPAEAALLAAGGDLRSQVLIAPHHGSSSSSTAALVAATQPELVIFATGRANRWHFPRPAVLRRWQGTGAQVLITGRDGAVSVHFGPSGMTWSSELARAPWPWRAYGMMRELATKGDG